MTPLASLLSPVLFNPRRLLAAALVLPLAGCVVAPPREARYERPEPRREYREPRQAAPVEQTLYFYPSRDQSEALQDRDRYECYRWAVRETGTDPGMRPVRQTAAPNTAPVVRDPGATVGGAVTGAAVGAIASSPRHTGAGLVLGAIFGGLLAASAEEGRAQAAERRQDARREDWDARQAPLDNFRRAMSACMSGRGYSVR